MFRAVPLRVTAGLALLPIAALLTAECGGNDVVDPVDASADATFDGGPLDGTSDAKIADVQGETSSQDSAILDAHIDVDAGSSDAEGGSPDAADAAHASDADAATADASDAEAGNADAADAEAGNADAGDAEAGVEGGTLAAPSLGTARTFALLAGAAITNTGATAIVGDVGLWPTAAPPVGLTAGQVTGTIYPAGGPIAMQAEADLTTAYADLAGRPCEHQMTSVDLGGKTLPPGVYCFAVAATQAVGDLTLDGQGDANAVWIFQIASTLTIATSVSTTVINSGNACNVYWQVGSSATINGGAQFKGNILAQASISLLTGASVSPGRALTQTAAVTMDTNAISNAGCP
jgi:hypothetical protein